MSHMREEGTAAQRGRAVRPSPRPDTAVRTASHTPWHNVPLRSARLKRCRNHAPHSDIRHAHHLAPLNPPETRPPDRELRATHTLPCAAKPEWQLAPRVASASREGCVVRGHVHLFTVLPHRYFA
eukprot:7385976-Prymnesium_polylepis.1